MSELVEPKGRTNGTEISETKLAWLPPEVTPLALEETAESNRDFQTDGFQMGS